MNINTFDQAVAKQLETMDSLLSIQIELEKIQELQKQFSGDIERWNQLQREIQKKKEELEKLQSVFKVQTEDAIRSYQLRGTI